MAELPSLRRMLSVAMFSLLAIMVVGSVVAVLVEQHFHTQEVLGRNQNAARSVASHVADLLMRSVPGLEAIGASLKGGSDDEHIQILIDSVLKQNPALARVQVLDADGWIRHASPPQKLSLDCSQQPFFLEAFHGTGKVWSDAYLSAENGIPFVSLSFRGAFGGVLAAHFSTQTLSPLALSGISFHDGYVAVVDRKGTVVAHSIAERAAQRENLGQFSPLRRALAGVATNAVLDFGGRKTLVSATPVGQTGWAVVIVQPVEAALASHAPAQRILLAVLALTSMVAIVAVIVLQARILRPMASYASRMRAVAGGSYDVAGAPLFRELVPLHESFLSMVDEVRRRELSLAAARDSAQAASRAKSWFLANMSHEIRTPLNAISGYTELLRMGGRDSPLFEESLDNISRASLRLLEEVTNVLEYARTESVGFRLNAEPFSLRDLLVDTLALIAPRLDPARVVLESSFDASIPDKLLGDRIRVGQVLANLLGNASKFTTDGKIAVTATLAGTEPLRVRLEVTDTGRGMSRSFLDHVFQPFSQEDESLSRAHGGIGLGLALCHQIVMAMGGEISVESEIGRGSVFRVTLPFAGASRHLSAHAV